MLNKYQIVVNDILNDIRSGRSAPGSRVASIRELMTRHDVSQITVLRAFRELAGAGEIVKQDGNGYFVKTNQSGVPSGNTVLCAFRPPRAFQEADNFGNRINCGIFGSAIENRLSVLSPKSIIYLKEGRTPDATAAAELAEEIADTDHLAGIILDMRYGDDLIQDYILPAAGALPVVLVGRRSRLNINTVSAPVEACASDAAKLAIRSGKCFFAIHVPLIADSDALCKAFCDALVAEGIAQNSTAILSPLGVAREEDAITMNQLCTSVREAAAHPVIFSTSDIWSVDVIATLKKHHLHPGRDYSLISYQGLRCAFYHDPKITTIALDVEEFGRLAIQAILNQDTRAVTAHHIRYHIELNNTL